MPAVIVATAALISAAVTLTGAAALGLWAYFKRPSFWNKTMTALHLPQLCVDVVPPADLEQGMCQPPRQLHLPTRAPTYASSRTTDCDLPLPPPAYLPVTFTGTRQVREAPIFRVDVSVAQKNTTTTSNVKLARSRITFRSSQRPYWITRRLKRVEPTAQACSVKTLVEADSLVCAVDPASVPLPTSDTKDSVWVEEVSIAIAAELFFGGLYSEAVAYRDTSEDTATVLSEHEEHVKAILTALEEYVSDSTFPPPFFIKDDISNSSSACIGTLPSSPTLGVDAPASYVWTAHRMHPWCPALGNTAPSPQPDTDCSPELAADGGAHQLLSKVVCKIEQTEPQDLPADAEREEAGPGRSQARPRSVTSAWWNNRTTSHFPSSGKIGGVRACPRPSKIIWKTDQANQRAQT